MRTRLFKEDAISVLPFVRIMNGIVVPIDKDETARRELLEFWPELQNKTQEVISQEIVRYQKIVGQLKAKFNYQCQLCHFTFEKEDGRGYCEAHHVRSLSDGGSQNEENVLILCANHHRMMHYAKEVVFYPPKGRPKHVTINGEGFEL